MKNLAVVDCCIHEAALPDANQQSQCISIDSDSGKVYCCTADGIVCLDISTGKV